MFLSSEAGEMSIFTACSKRVHWKALYSKPSQYEWFKMSLNPWKNIPGGSAAVAFNNRGLEFCQSP